MLGVREARTQLRGLEPQFLVTALALREYNGLHLVYLAGAADLPTRSIVYCDSSTSASPPKSRRPARSSNCSTGWPRPFRLYASAIALPASDRRIVTRPDRRHSPRGGRRVTDLQIAGSV